MSQINGRISQIIGPVIDVYFDTKGENPEKVLPKIHEALKVKRPDGRDLVIEVQQHIGEDTVRCVAMDNTDGLQRGLEVVSTGNPILMPAGEQIKGRMMNVIGQPRWRSGVPRGRGSSGGGGECRARDRGSDPGRCRIC